MGLTPEVVLRYKGASLPGEVAKLFIFDMLHACR